MAGIFDVANWFLTKEPMTHKKLQKMCYYYEAWGWALYDRDLISDTNFEAWVHGPVSPKLYNKYRDNGWNLITQFSGEIYEFSEEELNLLESVWLTYGSLSANDLSVLAHKEEPWLKAREGLDDWVNSNVKISNEIMRNFYRNIYVGNQGV